MLFLQVLAFLCVLALYLSVDNKHFLKNLPYFAKESETLIGYP